MKYLEIELHKHSQSWIKIGITGKIFLIEWTYYHKIVWLTILGIRII